MAAFLYPFCGGGRGGGYDSLFFGKEGGAFFRRQKEAVPHNLHLCVGEVMARRKHCEIILCAASSRLLCAFCIRKRLCVTDVDT